MVATGDGLNTAARGVHFDHCGHTAAAALLPLETMAVCYAAVHLKTERSGVILTTLVSMQVCYGGVFQWACP